jgi:hypothetical protein
MKKILLCSLLISCLHPLLAQHKFCPQGAEWHYAYSEGGWPGSPPIRNLLLKHRGDSIVGNDTLRLLDHSFPYPGPSCIRQKGDTVFFLHPVYTFNKWQVLYNFSATAGQKWIDSLYSSSGAAKIYTITVNSVTTTVINSKTLRVLNISVTSNQSSAGNYMGNITEIVGGDIYLFPLYDLAIDGPGPQSLLCYKDNTFPLKKFTAEDCDYTSVGIKEYAESPIKLYPVPASDELWLEFKSVVNPANIRVTIYNLIGQPTELPGITARASNLFTVNIKNLPPGMYFIRVSDKEKQLFSQRILKD